MKKHVVYIVVDGLPDLPTKGTTPLKEARKPNLDWFAKNGSTGEMTTIPKSYWTDTTKASASHIANISILGYDFKKFPIKRGPLEAVGAGVPYQEGHLAVRCNFASVNKDMVVVDRHVSRSSFGLDEIARYINQHVDIGVPFTFMRTFEHRAVLILKNKLSDAVTTNDPYKNGEKVKRVEATKPDAVLTARLLQEFIEKAHNVIEYHPKNAERLAQGLPPANYILIREAGNQLLDLMPHFPKRWKIKKAVCIASNGAMKATCLLAGFSAVTIPELPFEETLDFIFENIEELLPDYEFIFAHIKAVDEAGHDGDFERRKRMIEAIDKKLTMFKDFDGIVVVTADHITSTEKKSHMPGPVPIVVYGRGKKDAVKIFDEFSVKKGKLKNYTGLKLLKYVFGR